MADLNVINKLRDFLSSLTEDKEEGEVEKDYTVIDKLSPMFDKSKKKVKKLKEKNVLAGYAEE